MKEKFIFVVKRNGELKYVGSSYRMARSAALKCGANDIWKYRVNTSSRVPSFEAVARHHSFGYLGISFYEVCV